MPTPRRRHWIWLGVIAAVAGAVLAFDSNWLKGPIERAVSDATGRPFHIDGDFDIDLRLHPRVLAYGVRFGNPSWAGDPQMLRIDRAWFSIALLPLLRGRVVFPEVELSKPVVDLERNVRGDANWTLAREEEPDESRRKRPPPQIGRLTVDEGLLMFSDHAAGTALTLEVQTAQRADGGGPGVTFRAFGRYKARRLDAEGSGGSILSIGDTTLPYPLRARYRIGPTQGTVEGTITGLAAFAAAELKLDARGESLSELFPLLGISLPPTPPWHITGRLVRDGTQWRFHNFAGRVGDSDVAGDADVVYSNGRARLLARLVSQVLDLDDLAGFIGARPQAGPDETASQRQQAAKARAEAEPTVLPDMPIRLERLRAMDADVRFKGRSIRGRRTPIEDVETHLVLDGGVLTTRPLNFGVAGGSVVSTVTLDGRDAVAGVRADVEFRRIDLSKLFPGNATIRKSTGLVGGRAELDGRGNTFADLLADADGTLGLVMSGGQVSNLVLELAGLDVAEALGLLFRGDRQVEVRCAVADLEVRDGRVRSKSTIVDTTDTNIKIDGEINLANEQLDLTLHPLPKDYSPLSLRSPIHVRGTFKDPTIRPDEKLLVRGGVAAILGAVAAPLAALIGLVESGPGDDADCERLIAAVEQHAGARPEAGAP